MRIISRKLTISVIALLLLIGVDSQEAARSVGPADAMSPTSIQAILERVLSWQLQHPKHELWEWPNGAFYAGIMAHVFSLRAAAGSRGSDAYG